MSMKITFDKEADAAYIYFKDTAEGKVAKTISLNEEVDMDLDENGKTIGIEILETGKNLPFNAINSAVFI